MTSEIRTNSLTSRAGLSTVTLTDSGPMFSGITTFVDNSGFNLGTGSSIFTPASNTLTFGTNSNERLRIASNGHVAIGTDSPNSALPLTIAGQYPGIQFKDNQGTTDFNINTDSAAFRIQTGTAGAGPSEKFRIGSSGQIGLSGANYGSSGQVLTSQGSGSAPTWTTVSGTTINNRADNRVLTATGSDNVLNAESNVHIDGSGRLMVGTTTEGHAAGDNLTVADSGNCGITIRSGSSNNGVIYFSDGTSGSAEYRGAVQYNHTDNYLRFYTNGTERLRILANGAVGINTSNFSSVLNNEVGLAIHGSSNDNCRINLSTPNKSSTLIGYYGLSNRFGVDVHNGLEIRDVEDSYTTRLRIDNAGRVMVNQTTNLAGTAKLEVMGTGDNSYPMYSYAIGVCDTQAYNVSNGTGMGIGFSYKHNSAGATALGCGIRGFKENTTDGNYAGAMAFYTRANGAGAGERGRFTSAGTFGVNTVNPDSNYKIDCNGKLRIGDGNAGHRIQFSRSGLGDELVIGVDGYGSSTNNEAVIQSSINTGRPLVLRTSNGDRLRIAANGRVGVYETEAKIGNFAEAFQVRGLYSNQYAIAAKINQSSGSIMRFSTKDPTNGNDAVCGSITGNGTSSSFNTSSDYRLKENDVKISDGITRIKQLRPIRFNWKTDSSSTQDGFFAHEVSPVVPESVTGEKDAEINEIGEGYQKIDHSKLVPLLTAALQEAITKIEKLEQDNIALRARVTNLEGN